MYHSSRITIKKQYILPYKNIEYQLWLGQVFLLSIPCVYLLLQSYRCDLWKNCSCFGMLISGYEHRWKVILMRTALLLLSHLLESSSTELRLDIFVEVELVLPCSCYHANSLSVHECSWRFFFVIQKDICLFYSSL